MLVGVTSHTHVIELLVMINFIAWLNANDFNSNLTTYEITGIVHTAKSNLLGYI